MVKWLKLKIQVSVSKTQKSFFFKGKEIDTDRALWDRVQDDAKRKQQRQNEVLHCYLKKWIIEQFVERVNRRRSAWIVTVISLVVIIIHSNRWVHAFHSKRPKAFSLSLLNVLIFTALINAHSNYSLIEITVSYFIRNPLFESFQMGVHRLVSWCCLMRGGRVRVLTGHTQLSLNPSSENDKRPLKNWMMDYISAADFWCHQCGIYPSVSALDLSIICNLFREFLCYLFSTQIFFFGSFGNSTPSTI